MVPPIRWSVEIKFDSKEKTKKFFENIEEEERKMIIEVLKDKEILDKETRKLVEEIDSKSY